MMKTEEWIGICWCNTTSVHCSLLISSLLKGKKKKKSCSLISTACFLSHDIFSVWPGPVVNEANLGFILYCTTRVGFSLLGTIFSLQVVVPLFHLISPLLFVTASRSWTASYISWWFCQWPHRSGVCNLGIFLTLIVWLAPLAPVWPKEAPFLPNHPQNNFQELVFL